MKTSEEKMAKQILDDYFDNTLGSRLNAKLGAKLALGLILSAIEKIDCSQNEYCNDKLADTYNFWYGVEKIIKESK